MADLAGSGRRARYIRILLLVTALVVAVDLAAAVLQIRSNSRSDSARAEVTAGLKYEDDMGTILQDTLAAETGARGYLLTGESSYLGPAKAAVDAAPAALRQIKAGSRGDPALQRDYMKLVALLEARLKDLVTSVDLFKRGDQAAAIKLVRTNQGNTLTRQAQSLATRMRARSAQRVTSARNSSRSAQLWAERAAIAAYLSSALLLVAMVLLFRTYRLAEAARRASRMAQLEAERLNLAKSGFLSRVSHELRTPLNAILGFGQLLERDLVEQGERETLGQMLGAGRHLLAIVDDLLDLSRIEGGELRLSVEPVQIADALAEAKSLISPAATTAAVGVRQRPVNVDLYVRADRQRLIQVLLNLVSNAVKYNRRGGNVVISAGRTDGEMVRVEVSDTGTGISEEAITRLFTPFERLDAASRGIEGTGLGLALARGLVESMGGSLTLASEEGVGTTVSVELPLASPDELAAPRPRRVDPAAVAGSSSSSSSDPLAEQEGLRAAISVLYIEDNPSNVRLVEKIFGLSSDLGLHVAREGSSGVALARELHPDVVLLDLHLPDIPGEQVLAALRGDDQLADTPVIIVSADASPVQAKRLLAAGANGYLTKPFDIDQLLAAIRTRGTPPPVTELAEIVNSLLDPPMVASLHVLSNNSAVGPGQIGQMLETFRYDARGMLSGVHEAIAEQNLAAAEREAHRLAGGAGAVGAGRFRALCKDLENRAREGALEPCRDLDGRLDEAFEMTWNALAREFANELDQQPVRVQPPQAG
jgi:signal transduction histidine kinase/ActR/RegA family two-component response regulator/HPt (histidine-containing phosphotransfer) domain-containing protein